MQTKGAPPQKTQTARPPIGLPWTKMIIMKFMKLSPSLRFFIIANFAFLLFGMYMFYFALQLESLDDDITRLISFDMSTYKKSLLWTGFFIIFSSFAGMNMGIMGTNPGYMFMYTSTYIYIIGCLFFSTLYDLESSGKPNSLQIGLKGGILKGMQAFNQSNTNSTQSERAGIAGALQMAQSKFQCCGWHGSQDYRALNGGKVSTLPWSCCQSEPVTAFAPFGTCHQLEGIPRGTMSKRGKWHILRTARLFKRRQLNRRNYESKSELPQVVPRLDVKADAIFKGCHYSEMAQLPGKLVNLYNVLLVLSMILFIVSIFIPVQE